MMEEVVVMVVVVKVRGRGRSTGGRYRYRGKMVSPQSPHTCNHGVSDRLRVSTVELLLLLLIISVPSSRGRLCQPDLPIPLIGRLATLPRDHVFEPDRKDTSYQFPSFGLVEARAGGG